MPHGRAEAALGDAHLDFKGKMSYGDYLAIDDILAAQHPLTTVHDEMLFIVIHQASELWLKLVLHELGAARDCIIRDDLSPAFKMMARVSRVFDQLIQSWNVLSTMTPSDYLAFRDALGNSSGFQSHQYRMLEFMLGNKNPVLIRPHQHNPVRHAAVQAMFDAPSLYDEVARLFARQGFPIAQARIEKDAWGTTEYDETIAQAWRTVYHDPKSYWDLYELGEKLVDIEAAFRQWRFQHLTTVQRVIGFRKGTGGTTGVGYLKKVIDTELFPELWQVRTTL